MWGLPMFDLRDAAGVHDGAERVPKVYGDRYIRMSAFDSSHGWESVRLSFIVNRPKEEPGFRLERQEVGGRNIRYTTKSYAVDRPEGAALRWQHERARFHRAAGASPKRAPVETRSTCAANSTRSASARCSTSSTANWSA